MHECVHLENILNVLRKQHRKAVVSHLPFPWRYQIIDSKLGFCGKRNWTKTPGM